MASDPRTESMVFSYLALRRVIGILGISLPFVLFFGGLLFADTGLRGSLSSYYHTGMRNIFVGTLCVIGFFLLSYKGYPPLEGKLNYLRSDRAAGYLACVFALGVALFPTSSDGEVTAVMVIHFISMAGLLLTLAYFSWFLFTKTHPNQIPSKKKLRRNLIYRTCSVVIVICLLLIAANAGLEELTESLLTDLRPVIWLESLAIIAFGVSWFVKGEYLRALKD